MIHCVPDHPRSRGVYATIASTAAQWAGSSPLARGLLTVAILNSKVAGIIPARAGFTGTIASILLSHRGSSPLARGLPTGILRRSGEWGIIPARAGFTRTVTPTAGTSRDHPRSRGVYRRHGKPNHHGPGSSPLARGLPTRKWCSSRCCGIIPARAGFTCTGMSSAAPSADHPRSRGVYSFAAFASSALSGSSPLARGLPTTRSRVRVGVRIIPARAGFTERRFPLDESAGGSSPLARGLRDDRLAVGWPVGIIPARAGFTPVHVQRVDARRDHPRSRGVYCDNALVGPLLTGSSPLARGLP